MKGLHAVALDKSALLELTEALSSADDGQLMRTTPTSSPSRAAPTDSKTPVSTNCPPAGLDPVHVALAAGHSDPAFTLRTYAHPATDASKRIRAAQSHVEVD